MYYNIPDFDPRMVGWIVKYARENYWKVKDFMLLEDLIHQGFECLLIAKQKYPDRYENDPKRFINTVKLIFANDIPYLQNRNIRMPEGQLMRIGDMCGDGQEYSFTEMLAGADEDQEVRECIADAPERIRKILEAFFDEASAVHGMVSRKLRYHMDGTRDSLNERFCNFLGLDPRQNDICQELKDYLRPEFS